MFRAVPESVGILWADATVTPTLGDLLQDPWFDALPKKALLAVNQSFTD